MTLITDVASAYEETFYTAMEDPRQLVTIHRRLGQGRGRRTLELSLNRSIVVLTVAAWQAYIEELARVFLDSMGTPDASSKAGRTLTALWHNRRQELEKAIDNYSTANADNTTKLLSALGFDARPHWTWGSGGGHVTPGQAIQRLNQWVRVRNAIAHGSSLPSNTRVITENESGPTVRLKDAEACISFIEHMTQGTNLGAGEFAQRAFWTESRIRSDEAQRRAAEARIASLLR